MRKQDEEIVVCEGVVEQDEKIFACEEVVEQDEKNRDVQDSVVSSDLIKTELSSPEANSTSKSDNLVPSFVAASSKKKNKMKKDLGPFFNF